MNIFLANIGNRDLAYNIGDKEDSLFLYLDKGCKFWKDIAGELKFEGEGTRLAAEKLNADFAVYQEYLSAPILTPSLEFALRKVEKIDQLILFVTDNPKEDERNWRWDTIETGKIIEKLIRSDNNLTTKIKNIKTVTIENTNPSNYDEAYDFIKNKLNSFFRGDSDNIFTAISGGIPAMNSALRAYSIERFGVKTHLIQKAEPSTDEKERGIHGQVRSVNSWTFRKTIILRIVKMLLQRFDYEGVLDLLETEKVNNNEIKKLCSHAKARINFDYQGAENFLVGLSDTQFNNLKEAALNDSPLQRIAETAFIGHFLFMRGDFIGFLTRTACFREFVINLIADRLGIKFTADFISVAAKYSEIRRKWNKLDDYAQEVKIETILREMSPSSKLTQLCELRNASLHHARGISITNIKGILPNPGIEFSQITSDIINNLLILEELCRQNSQIYDPSQLFRKINEMVYQLLEKHEV